MVVLQLCPSRSFLRMRTKCPPSVSPTRDPYGDGLCGYASAILRQGGTEKVKLVITSPPYLDVTDYHEDQWLRLWFLGGPAKPVTGQGKDDRHRRVEAYWQFLREACAGVVSLLDDSAHIVIRIGGTRLGQDELRVGCIVSAILLAASAK